MHALEILSQRFMVSPDGLHADWMYLDEVQRLGPGWLDGAGMSDAELGREMVRRMWESAPERATKLPMAAERENDVEALD